MLSTCVEVVRRSPGPVLPVVPLHGFVFVDDLAVVETVNTEMSVTGPDELATLHSAFEALRRVAVERNGAGAVLGRLISRCTGGTC